MDSIFKLAVILSAVDHLTGPLRNTARQLESLDRVATRAQGMKELGTKLTVAGAAAGFASTQMMGYLNSLLGPALEGEEALARVAAMTKENIEAIDKAATQWSLIHMDSDTAFIAAAQRMIQSGLSIEKSIEGTRVAMTVARATGSDHIQTARLLASVYDTMGDKIRPVGAEMERLGDILAATRNTFQIEDLDQFSKTFALAARAAIPLRIPLAQVTTVLGALNRAGLQGRQAGGAFTSTMQRMDVAARKLHFTVARTASGQLDLIATLGNIQKKFGVISELSPRRMNKFQDAFGPNGLVVLSMLLDEASAAQGLARSVAAVENPAVRAADALAQIEGTGSGQVQIIANNWERVREILGGFILPLLVAMRPHIQGWTTWAAGFIQAHPTFFKVALGLFAIVTAVVSVAGAVLTASAGLVLLGGHGVAAFAKVSSFAFQASSKVTHFGGKLLLLARAQLPALIASISSFASRARAMAVLVGTQMGRELMVAASAIRAATIATWQWTVALLANPVGMIIAAVVALAAGIYLIFRNWQTLADFYEVVWAKVTAVFQSFGAWVGGFLTGLWSRVQSLFGGGLSGVLKMLFAFSPAGVLMLAFDAVRSLLSGTTWYKEGVALIQGLIDGIKSMASAAWESVAGIASGIKDRFKSMLGISSPSRVFLDFGTNVVAGLARGVQMAEGLAAGRVAQLARTVTAAAAIAASPMIAAAAPIIAEAAPLLPTTTLRLPGSGPTVQIHFNPIINLSGSATPEDRRKLIDELRPIARELAQMVEDVQNKEGRRKF